MSNEEKILEMLTEMKADISELKAVQAQQGEVLAQQGETLAKHGQMLEELKDVQKKQGEKLADLDKRSKRTAVLLEGEIGPNVQLLFEGLVTHHETLATNERVEKIEDTVEQKVMVLESVVKSHSERIAKLEKAV